MSYSQGRSIRNCAHGWTLNWIDDFSSSAIDTNKWVLQAGGPSVFGSDLLQYYTDREDENANVYIEDGKLVIEAREEEYEGQSYTSGMIRTKDLKSFGNGGQACKFEVRAKLAGTQSLFPALWFSSQDEPYNIEGESSLSRHLNGEIDMIEFLGSDTDKIYSTLWCMYVDDISAYESFEDIEDENYDSESGSSVKTFNDYASEYHTFGMEWYTDRILFQIDGKTYYIYTFSDYQFSSIYQPFRYDFYFRMNIAVGGDWAGAPDETSVFPAKMYIDWVKYSTQAI